MTKTIELFTISDLADFVNNFVDNLIRYMYHLSGSLSFSLIHANHPQNHAIYIYRVWQNLPGMWKIPCEDINRRTIEISKPTAIFRFSYCLNVHSAALKLASLISGKGLLILKKLEYVCELYKFVITQVVTVLLCTHCQICQTFYY